MQHYYDKGLVEHKKGPSDAAPTLFKGAVSKLCNLPESNLAIWMKHHLTYIFVNTVILTVGICCKETMLYAHRWVYQGHSAQPGSSHQKIGTKLSVQQQRPGGIN